MTSCFTGTYKHSPPGHSPIFWQDTEGYHSGAVELIEGRFYSRAIFGSSNNPDTSQTLLAWVSALSNLQDVRPRKLLLGQYYPRIHRPCSTMFPYEIKGYPEFIETSAVAVEVLLDRMDHLFRVIEPDGGNLEAYGHEIRNLLLLGCMEVEAGWSAVLRANGYSLVRMNTTDYVKLLGPLHLCEYELKLASYPRVAPLTPFAKWNAAKPTQDLEWYDAYNQTKHDREKNFAAGTLKYAIDAVAAAVILFYAQFGQTYEEDDPFTVRLRFKQFRVTHWPTFAPEEWYVTSEPGSWAPVNYPL